MAWIHQKPEEIDRLAKAWVNEWQTGFMTESIFHSLLPTILDQYGNYIEREPDPNATDRIRIGRIPE